MSVKVNGFDNNPFDQRSVIAGFSRVIITLCRLVLAGAYVAGGDTIDWTNGGVNSAVPSAQSFQTNGPVVATVADNGPAAGILANGGNYVLTPGTLLTNWLLRVYKTAGSEYSGTYLADALTDTIFVTAYWFR